MAHGKERCRVQGKAQAELRGRQAEIFDIHKRRATDKHKERGQPEAADHRQAGKHRITQQRAVAAKRIAQVFPQAPLGGMGFGQLHDGHHQARHGHHGEYGKHFAPAPDRNHQAAGQWRQNRRHTHHQHQQRHQARGFVAGVQVAHNRPGNHHPGTGAKRLYGAKADQHFDGRRQRAAHAAYRKDHQPGINGWLAPEHITDRPVEQLAHANDHEEHRQAHLHRCRRGVQAGAEGGQGRQVDVDGEGADSRDQAQ